jgi:magnesium-protoporphyrin IX monomethyl ester (oxidative) cyclase
MGLAILAKFLQNAGHEVEIYDLNCLRYDHADAIEYLPRDDFDLIGVSGIITTYKYLNFLVPALKDVYEAPLVLGGGGFTSGHGTYMENLRPDYGVIGEGEYTLLELADCLEMGQSTDHILGLTYYKDEELIVNPPRPLEQDLDNFPMMAYDLLDMETYITNVRHNKEAMREVGMIATRGCPLNCVYCYHVFGKGVRYRSVDSVLSEMEYLIDNYQVESFLFGDECFTARRSWIEEFCNRLIEKNWGIEFSCFSRVDTIKEETMELMAKAGCFFMGFGFESGSQKILDEMDKRVTVEQAYNTAMTAAKYFRAVPGTFMFGMPGEDDESIEDNIHFCISLMSPKPFFFVAPYPGTQMYYDNMDKILEKFGSLHNFFLALGDKDAGHFVINLTQWSDEEAIKKKINMERHTKFGVYIRYLYSEVGRLVLSESELDYVLVNNADDAIRHSLSTNRITQYVEDGKKYTISPRDIRELIEATGEDEDSS